MAEYLAPGVYVEEFDSGSKAMEGVSTSTAGFIGVAQRGPLMGKPSLVTSFAEYQRIFGSYLPSFYGKQRFLPYSVEQFFNNGGSSAYVMRVAGKEDVCASYAIVEGDINLQLIAANAGDWGNKLQVHIHRNYERNTMILKDGAKENTYIVKNASLFQIGEYVEVKEEDALGTFYKIVDIQESTITLDGTLQGDYIAEGALATNKVYAVQYDVWIGFEGVEESYLGVSLQSDMPNGLDRVLAKSQLLHMEIIQVGEKSFYQSLNETICTNQTYMIQLQGGITTSVKDDPYVYLGEDLGPGKRRGLAAFQEISDASILCIPGITLPSVQSALVSFCEGRTSCLAILDVPLACATVDEVLTQRSFYDSSYGAMYHPWLGYYDALEKRNFFLPPSGVMAGIYARCDNERGVHKAPANEVVRGCTSLSVTYNEAEQGKLNPKGVNLIRALPGNGIRVWGARTVTSDSSWKYINVRRLFIYMEESIRANTNWAVFEPNDEVLWSRVQGSVTMFLTTLWRNGALAGATPDEAFFVNIGKTTMTQDDILNGRLICVIGVAPVRPAEFVIFRITQKMEDAA